MHEVGRSSQLHEDQQMLTEYLLMFREHRMLINYNRKAHFWR
jgi:hypothetical protein